MIHRKHKKTIRIQVDRINTHNVWKNKPEDIEVNSN
jgi:hypothetical protein